MNPAKIIDRAIEGPDKPERSQPVLPRKLNRHTRRQLAAEIRRAEKKFERQLRRAPRS